MRALHRDPDQRYQTIEQLRSDLGRYLAAQGSKWSHLELAASSNGISRRAIVGLASTALIAASLGLWYYQTTRRPKQDPTEPDRPSPGDRTTRRVTPTPSQTGQYFGRAVAVVGNLMAVSAIGHRNPDGSRGAVFVFESHDKQWRQKGVLRAPRDADAGDLGWSVAVSEETIVVGARRTRNGRGVVFCFAKERGQWRHSQRLPPPNPEEAPNALFGESVAIQDDIVVVGCPRTKTPTKLSGSVYVFMRATDEPWRFVTSLTPPNSQRNYFGRSVAISEDTIVVGAPQDQGKGVGAAHVYRRDGDGWRHEESLRPTSTRVGGYLGGSVAISGDRIVVGEAGGTEPGAAYVFEKSEATGRWAETCCLGGRTGTVDGFGCSVAVARDRILVGAYKERNETGGAYVFVAEGPAWKKRSVAPSRVTPGSHFGFCVAAGPDLLITAPQLEESSGRVYLYD
ncbi:MAG: hypothetical protein AAF628_26910 [Planctomycetota bacterium]